MNVSMKIFWEFFSKLKRHRHQYLERRRQADTPGKHVVLGAFNPKEEQVIDVSHGACRRKQRLVLFGEEKLCAMEIFMGAPALEPHQFDKAVIVGAV